MKSFQLALSRDLVRSFLCIFRIVPVRIFFAFRIRTLLDFSLMSSVESRCGDVVRFRKVEYTYIVGSVFFVCFLLLSV